MGEKIKTLTFDEIRNSISKPTTGLVDSLITSTESKGVNVGSAWQPSKIGNYPTPNWGEEFLKLKEQLSKPRHDKKTGKVTTGWGKNKKVQSLSEYHKEQHHLKQLQNNPYSQQLDDGTWIYAKSDADFLSKKNKHLESQRKNHQQIIYNKDYNKLIQEGYTEVRADRIMKLRDKSMDALLKEKQKIIKQLDKHESGEFELNEYQLQIYKDQLEDIDNALIHVETIHGQTDQKAVDIHTIEDPENVDPNTPVMVHGQRMTYGEWMDKIKRTEKHLDELSGNSLSNSQILAPPANPFPTLEDRMDEDGEQITEGEAYKRKYPNQNFIYDPISKQWLYTGNNPDYSLPDGVGKYEDVFTDEGYRIDKK